MLLDAIFEGEFSVTDKGSPHTEEYKETRARFTEIWDRLKQGVAEEQQKDLEKLLSYKTILLGMETAEQCRIAFAAGVELQREIQATLQRIDCQ